MSVSVVPISTIEIVGELLSVIERLGELLSAETAILGAKGQPAIEAAGAPKTHLVLRYEALLRALNGASPETLRDVPGATRLRPAIERLTGLATANAAAIDRHIKATKHVMELVARAAQRAAEPEFTYGRERLGYGIRSARRTAVAVNRVL